MRKKGWWWWWRWLWWWPWRHRRGHRWGRRGTSRQRRQSELSPAPRTINLHIDQIQYEARSTWCDRNQTKTKWEFLFSRILRRISQSKYGLDDRKRTDLSCPLAIATARFEEIKRLKKRRESERRISFAGFSLSSKLIFLGGVEDGRKDYQGLCSIDIVPQGFIPATTQIEQIHRSGWKF